MTTFKSKMFTLVTDPWLLGATALGILIVWVGAMTAPGFMVCYLGAFAFWLQLTLGFLGIMLIHDVTGGRWGMVIEPFLRSSLPTLCVLAFAFLPLAFFADKIYLPSMTRVGPHGFHHGAFFLLRGATYFGIWITIAAGFRRRKTSGRSTLLWSGISLMALLFSISIASMDWIMTVDPEWTSTGFGVIFIAGCLCAGFAALTALSLRKEEKVITAGTKKPLVIDLGNLVLMAVMFWAYVDFMQYLIIWSGQLPREIKWYDLRSAGGWSIAIAACALFGFALPVAALLFRKLKRSPHVMQTLMALILFARALESEIWTAPGHSITIGQASFNSMFCLVAIGAPWLAIFAQGLSREPVSTYRNIARAVQAASQVST